MQRGRRATFYVPTVGQSSQVPTALDFVRNYLLATGTVANESW